MKQRMINTKFWSDGWVDTLDPIEKLLFLYLLTNERTNVAGIYELPIKLMSVETGIEKSMIETILKRFAKDNKIATSGSWVMIVNAVSHQNISSSKIRRGIEIIVESLPKAILDTLWIPYQYPMDTVPYSNSNSNLNSNSNPKSNSKPKKTTNKLSVSKLSNQDPNIKQVIEYFESQVNKMPRSQYQPMAAIELLKQHGLEKTLGAINAVVDSRGKQYAPNIASLEELRDKWVKLENFYARQTNKRKTVHIS